MPGTKRVYAIFGGVAPAELDKRIPEGFPGETSRQLGSGQWLVVADVDTPSALYEKFKSKGNLDCVILPVGPYYGWKDKAVWEWIETASK